MAKIIEAKAVISAEDKTGAVFDRIAKKLEGIGKSAKASANVDQLAASLKKAQEQMAAIDRFSASRDRFAAARTKFRETEVAVQKAAQAMKVGQGDADALAKAYDKAQTAVTRASAAFEKQQAAVLSAKRALGEMGIPANQAAAAQERLRTAVERTNAALDRQPGRLARTARAVAHGIGNIAPFAGPAILRATGAAARAGADVQSEIVRMRAAGVPESDIQRELGASADLAGRYTNVKRGDILERYKELRSVLLHPEEASTLLEPTVKANAALNALDRSGQMAEGLQFAIKGAEVMGLAQDPQRFEAYLDSFIKAQQVMGKTITPEQMFELAKYSKASGTTLSDRFKFTTGISLAQEMGGSTAGNSIDQFVKQITGGFQGSQHAAAKEFVALGLANKNDFETTRTGEIKGLKHGRKVAGSDLAQTDPDKYVYDYILPAMARAGITDPNAQIAEVRRLFPSGRAADLVSKLITQRPSFENHAKLYGQAQGLDAIGNNQTDPFVALNSLTTSLQSFAGVVTSPVMQDAASIMSKMASGIGGWGAELQKFNADHPDAAKAIGAGALTAGAVGGGILTYNLLSGLMTGFGLPAASAELTGAARLLDAAAVKLGGGGAPGVPVGPAGSLLGVLGTAAAVGTIGTALSYYAAKSVWGDPAGYGAGSGNMMLGAFGGDYSLGAEIARLHATKYPFPSGDFTLGGDGGFHQFGGSNFQRFKPIPGFDGIPMPQEGFGDVKNVKLTGSAEVHGDATLTVKIEPSSELLRATEMAKQVIKLGGEFNANGPGSNGRTSIDADPGAGGRLGHV